jgi:hypothetical protein
MEMSTDKDGKAVATGSKWLKTPRKMNQEEKATISVP